VVSDEEESVLEAVLEALLEDASALELVSGDVPLEVESVSEVVSVLADDDPSLANLKEESIKEVKVLLLSNINCKYPMCVK
jgi:hypothetical protein